MTDINDDKIPTLTEIVKPAPAPDDPAQAPATSEAKTAADNEFNFDDLVPGKALTQEDIRHIKTALNQQLKTKVQAHSARLYLELTAEIDHILNRLYK